MIADIRVPDSSIAHQAEDLARSVSSDFLFNHVIRCYWFSELFAQREGAKVDSELLFLSPVLHDLGFTDMLGVRIASKLRGAGAARTFLVEKGVSRELNEHPDGDLALGDLAKGCALSPGRFMRAFKRSFGVPVRRYLLYKRVEAAKSLMLYSNDSLLTVALEVGFTDQPAFNRGFREIVGTSPGRWRRANAPMPKAFSLPAED